jgi:hypothetical protein
MVQVPALPDNFRHITMAYGIRCNLAREPGKVALICDGRDLTYGRDDRFLAVTPMFHGAGLASALLPLSYGMRAARRLSGDAVATEGRSLCRRRSRRRAGWS